MNRRMHGLVTSSVVVVALAANSVAAETKPTERPGDYLAQAKALWRIAACGGTDEVVPPRFDSKTIERHCKSMTELYKRHKKRWVDQAKRFLGDVRPKDVPKTVIYPFGGGDLGTALVAFPDATEITTISLEAAGDARLIDTSRMGTLSGDLAQVGAHLRNLYASAYSATMNLQNASRDSSFPGTLMMIFAGLALHEMEPVSLRYFDVLPDGGVAYLSNAELESRAAHYLETKRGKTRPKKITHYWYAHDSAFGNVEIRFRPRTDARAPVRVYRHIVQNLDDPHLRADDRVLQHLRKKGKVSMMTKAASFLLWYDDFTEVRNYLLGHLAWMVSDASGIPPSHAGPAGYEQVTYGEFTGPLFTIDPKNTRKEFIKLWKEQPKRPLGFRFGYPDVNKKPHLMVTRPKNP